MRVAIIAQQRTGSSFLSSCLDAHSQVWSPPIELFAWDTWKALVFGICQSAGALDDFYVRGLIRSETLGDHPIGSPTEDPSIDKRLAPVRVIKIMHNQMLSTPRLDRYMFRNTDIHILHLHRENLLKQHVSNMLNKKRKVHRRPAFSAAPVPVARIRINPRHAIFRMRASRALYQWYDKRLSHHPKLEIVYEQIIGTHGLSESAAESVCQFLGIPPEPLETDMVKMNPDDLRLIITNYDEVARALAGTEFGQYLD